jgi:hypothetical protein
LADWLHIFYSAEKPPPHKREETIVNQEYSIFMPGLTARGPVYRANSPLGAYLSGLPALPTVVKYGAMAAALYAGYAKLLPFGIVGGAAAAFAIFEFFPDSSVQGSGAPTAAQIAADTAAVNVPISLQSDIAASVAAMTPSLSGFFNPGIYNRRIRRK